MIRIFTFSSVSLRQRVGQHLGRTLHVGLDDDRQLLHAAFGDLRLQRFERQTAALAPSARVFACSSRNAAICRALAASATWKTSPGCGSPASPSTSTGVEGPADFVGRRGRR
jgi:hypothetical protein